ncbi:MAG TPA: 2-isopropylmalate synthase, partial [Dongiaceae bacterium]
GITKIATDGAALIRDLAKDVAGESKISFEYSPESFTGTELDYAKEICEAVMEVFHPTPSNKLILNLPATVEMATPNIYADQIEWFSRNIKNRDSIILSLHPHNDRGTGVAAAELGVMAGADRIEGTLFGNGERTGNVDIITLALNMFTQGIDPGLDISDVEALRQVAEHCNRLPVHPRHPYAGDLVFTAFSGSHQDAINKGFKARRGSNSPLWEIPYLPIDPQDVGRSYEAVIRINSQSGKGGVAYVLEQDYGVALPRKLQIEFSKIVQQIADSDGTELTSARIWECFQREYLGEQAPLDLVDHRTWPEENGMRGLEATIIDNGTRKKIEGRGNGPVDAYLGALAKVIGEDFEILDYHEHSIGRGANATAIAYVEMSRPNGLSLFGVGMNNSIVTASLRAITSAVNRLRRKPV